MMQIIYNGASEFRNEDSKYWVLAFLVKYTTMSSYRPSFNKI